MVYVKVVDSTFTASLEDSRGAAALAADAAQDAEAPAAEPDPTEAPEPEKPAAPAKITAADIQRAATKAMNANKRDGVMAALKARGGALKDVPEADYPALLAEIEAL